MKISKQLVLICLSVILISSRLSATGVDVCIALSDARGGGSNNLNSITKIEDRGDWKKGSDKQPEFVIEKSYKISHGKSSAFALAIKLVYKKSGIKDIIYKKTIDISENGKKSFTPFEGITMNVISSGFEGSGDSHK